MTADNPTDNPTGKQPKNDSKKDSKKNGRKKAPLPHFPALDAIAFTAEEEAALDAIWADVVSQAADADGLTTPTARQRPR